MTRVTRIAVVSSLVSFSMVALASAHTLKHESTVNFHLKKNGQQADSLAGKVNSSVTRCEVDRVIRIYERVEGPDLLVDTVITDAEGKFEYVFPGDIPEGTYYAVAARKVLKDSDEHLHLCGRAKSDDVDVRSPGPTGG